MSTVNQLFTPGSQYYTNGAKQLTFTIPARSTAVISATVEFLVTDGSITVSQLGDMILTAVTGEAWQMVSAKSSNNSEGAGLWAWHYRNDTDTDALNVQVEIQCPNNIGYNPQFNWVGVVISGGMAGAPLVARVPTLDSYVNNNTGSALSTSINAATGGRVLAFVRQDASATGTPLSGSQLVSTADNGGGYSLVAYSRSGDETSSGTVQVGSGDTGVKGRIIALSFPDPVAGGQSTGSGALLGILSRVGTGTTAAAGGPVLPPPVVGNPQAVAHGTELTPAMVGPWALQGVTKGQEVLDSSLVPPARGYWRWGEAGDNLFPTNNWPANADDAHPEVLNDPSLLGGILQSPQMIDGYLYATGTTVIQYRDFPDDIPHYGQSSDQKYLFRGCRFRWTNGVDGSSITNVAYSTSNFQLGVHYCDIGLRSADPPGGEGLMHFNVGYGTNHRFVRNYHTLSGTFLQVNNAPGTEIVENYIDDYLYGFGLSGPSGMFGSDAGHLNGFSSEGNQTNIKINRNHIIAPSIDGSTGSTGYARGDIGYGSRPTEPDGTLTQGYGSGSLGSGRMIAQTDNIALFRNFGDNPGGPAGSIQVCDNFLGGTGYCIYAAGPAVQGFTMTGNRFTTKYYKNAGSYGPVADSPTWGQNNNVESDNCFYDDYGDGGDGVTATSDRQYPDGNGPRKNVSVFNFTY